MSLTLGIILLSSSQTFPEIYDTSRGQAILERSLIS